MKRVIPITTNVALATSHLPLSDLPPNKRVVLETINQHLARQNRRVVPVRDEYGPAYLFETIDPINGIGVFTYGLVQFAKEQGIPLPAEWKNYEYEMSELENTCHCGCMEGYI